MHSSQNSRTEFLARPGGRIASDVIGPQDAPLVVCVPGMGDVRGTFRHLRDSLLAEGFRVATFDLRGHGESDATFGSDRTAYDDRAAASDIVALIDHLGSPAAVVGNSMGAGAAVLAAAAAADRITALVLIGPFVRTVPQPTVMRWMLRVAMAGPWSTRVWLSYLPKMFPSRRDADFDQHRGEVGAALRRPGHAAAFRRTTHTDHGPAWAAAETVDRPTLVVMGDKDPDFPNPAAEAELIAARLSAEVFIVPGAGHYPQFELPQATNPQIAAFLARTVRHA